MKRPAKNYVLLTGCLMLACLWPADIQAGAYILKSGYLYNFAQFIEWPEDAFASPAAPFVLAVYGSNPFGPGIRAMEQRQIRGRNIRIIEIQEHERDIPHCHMIFLPETHAHHAEDLIARLNDRPVALVGESPGFASRGGVLNFFVEKDRVGFEVNVEAAHHHRLEVSSRLLRLARIVKPSLNRRNNRDSLRSTLTLNTLFARMEVRP